MKNYIFILLILLTLTTKTESQIPDSLKYTSIPPSEFMAAYQNSENGLLIDVREFFEYRKSRLKDAINLPSSGNLETATDTINKNRDLFFYCTSGFRSKRVARFFYDKGFTNLYSLDGGIVAWKKEGRPVVKKRIRKHDVRRTTHDSRRWG